MCDCLETTLTNVSAKIKEQLPKHDPESLSVRWQNRVFRLDNAKSSIPLTIQYSFRKLKNDGTPYAKKSSNSVNIHMNYCPLCGEKADS